jgi:hypothetical protein
MKLKKLSILMIAALLALLSTSLVSAQTAYQTPFTTSITILNVGTGTAKITLTYFAANSGTPINTSLADLPKGAGASVFVGNIQALTAGFQGAGVLSSDQPIIATLVQLPAGTSPVKNRPLSNGFSAGSNKVLLASVLKAAFNTTTVFSVQNAGAAAASFKVNLFNAANPAGAPIVLTVNALPAGSTHYFDMATTATVPNGFSGSAVIQGNTLTDSLVATAMELSTNGLAASAFEGVSGGGSTVFMASALCNFLVTGKPTNTSYAIQNVGTTTTSVKVTFSNGKTISYPTVAAGAKVSVQGCFGGNTNGFIGSATITAGTNGQIVALGKVSGAGISSAFLGAIAGAPKLALPYARWSETKYLLGTRQRSFIAIQNVGAPLAANTVTVKYYDKAGVLVGTHTLGAMATGQKLNSNPFNVGAAAAEFGSYPDGTFGGGAIIEGPASSQLVAVVRVASFVPATGTTVGEDYNGAPIQ